jgi:hypothetical protein
MTDAKVLSAALSSPIDFLIGEVGRAPVVEAPAPLGPLVAFTGNWIGSGFNTIFRPNSYKTPTNLSASGENVLELNLTTESLSFAPNLVSIPNRGAREQEDIFLNGVPYVHSTKDVTTLPARDIHFELGIWLSVPATTAPRQGVTLARMASIPHGTTINAQGTFKSEAGKPRMARVDIAPIKTSTRKKFPDGAFPSLTASNTYTSRLPQNLAPFIAAGTITQAMLTDPNTVLRAQIADQNITETITIDVSTAPDPPLFGGGTANIAFLLGANHPRVKGLGPNAQVVLMKATFWIETVIYHIKVPPMRMGDAPLVLSPVQTDPPVPLVPSFLVSIPPLEGKKFAGGTVAMSTTQIQYSQEVILNFDRISWPHVSVASLVPAEPIPVPTSLLPLA